LNKAFRSRCKIAEILFFIPGSKAQQVLTGCNSDGEASKRKELAQEVPSGETLKAAN